MSFSDGKINCTLLAKTGVSIAKMGWAWEKAFDFMLPNRALCIAIMQMWGAYSTGMTKNLVLYCVHRLSRMRLSRGDIATSTVPLQGGVYTTVHPIPEPEIGLKQGHWGELVIIICTPTIHCRGNRKPFQNKIINPTSPLFTQTTTHNRPFKITQQTEDGFLQPLSTHTPTHQNAYGEVFLTYI